MSATDDASVAADVVELTRLNLEFTEWEARGQAGMVWFTDKLADDLCFRRASGAMVDKAAFLQGLEDPGNTSEELTSDVTRVGVVGDWALADVAVRLRGIRSGQPVDGTFRNLRVFERTKDGWVCLVWFNRLQQADNG